MTRPRFYKRIEPRHVHGPVALNTMGMAISRATLLTSAEQANLLKPPTEGFERMRKGLATEADWLHLVTICSIGLSIEELGVVRGLRDLLTEADQALATIAQRAMASGQWRPPTLYASEIQQIASLLRMHAFQLAHVSWGERRKAHRHAASSVVARGGVAIKALGVEVATP